MGATATEEQYHNPLSATPQFLILPTISKDLFLLVSRQTSSSDAEFRSVETVFSCAAVHWHAAGCAALAALSWGYESMPH